MSRLRTCVVFAFVSCSILAFCRGASDDDYHECVRPCSNELSSRKTCGYSFIIAKLHAAMRLEYHSKMHQRELDIGKVIKLHELWIPPSKSMFFCDEFKSKDNASTCVNSTDARKSLLAINGKSPGPAIQICLGDTIEIVVHNKLGSDELAIHWHGIRQKDSNYMDGVPMITQCPILPFNGFRYKIHPESAGTYFYHAHSVSQQGDGVYGSLTVRGPRDDPSLERILVLSSRPPTPLTRQSGLYPPTPGELLVNGQARELTLRVKHGLRYLLRLVNANAYDCPVLLSLHGHSLQASAADGNPVQSMTGTHVVLFPGERLDGTLVAERTVGKYALDIQGLRDCRHLRHEAYILYEGTQVDSYTTRINGDSLDEQEAFVLAETGHHCRRISKNVICSLDLKDALPSQLESEVDEKIYVPFDMNAFSFFTDEMTDNSYNFYLSRYYPAYLSLDKGAARIPQVSGMSFKYPSSPILSQPEDTVKNIICNLDERSNECDDTPLYCECLQLIQVPSRKTIEVILIDEGFGGNVSHTFHLHGYTAQILGQKSLERPVTKNEIMSLDRDGRIGRNFSSPVRKDTFVVPNKGYIVLRIHTDNLGYWLWEARSTAIYPQLLGPGMKFLMRVGLHRNLPPLPIDFPSCGSNKGLDLIFETS